MDREAIEAELHRISLPHPGPFGDSDRIPLRHEVSKLDRKPYRPLYRLIRCLRPTNR